jgi:SAM-dependent methyltransferase
MTQSELSEDAVRNRDVWTAENAAYTGKKAREAWAQAEIRWGVFQEPETEVGALPDVAGMDVVELGCGTAYFSAWLAKRGARPVGIDVTPAQLETARECQKEFGLEFPLIEASAEDVPLPDESFDLALSEYGASIWCEPERWVAEAARLLRPGGELVFLSNSTISILCSPDEGKVGERLLRPQFGMYRFEWPDDEGVNFYLPHGEWIRVLRENELEVVALHELQAPADAEDHPHYDFVSAEWARKWPAEEIWRARKRA